MPFCTLPHIREINNPVRASAQSRQRFRGKCYCIGKISLNHQTACRKGGPFTDIPATADHPSPILHIAAGPLLA
jgi:hypothetical protein